MVDKLLQALKQAYAQLGLGDDVLTARAESLASTGLVTDENLSSVVASQKANLEAMQRDNDKRVSAALAKARKEHEDAIKASADEIERLKMELEKARKTAAGGGGNEHNAFEEAFNKRLDSITETIKSLTEANKGYEEKIKTMQSERETEIKVAKQKERREFIAGKAKEKGIPDWIIAHGFADIAEDATDEQIDAALNGYSQEIKTNFLPNKGGIPRFDGTKATKDMTDAIVKSAKM
jgi:membrane-associated HD superfamily phosphohydrolase